MAGGEAEDRFQCGAPSNYSGVHRTPRKNERTPEGAMSERIPVNFAELAMQYNLIGDPEPMYTFMGLDLDALTVPTQALTDSIVSAWTSALDNSLPVTYTLGPGWVTYGAAVADLRIDSTNAPVSGLRVGDALPNNCAALVRKLSAVGGRRNRGRAYMPGVLDVDAGNNGVLTTGALAQFQNDWDLVESNLVALIDVEGLVILHDSAPFTPTAITALTVQNKIATQRRRLRP